ncbi:hypothetical protein G6011_04527 [Alternaria panax]|uniref:Ubiquitin-like protease family profile domain-containing protein n=1 Tax=Alternaria panax TaxID=48097 RepID=A0AAD4IH56_9PLEO|nr:hypothetical protein G6011_04527 [Alternaria panax]
MPPKRKEDDKGHGQPEKRTKSEDNHNDNQHVIEVNWAIPKEKLEPIYKEKHAIEYAQALYQRDREEIYPQQTPLPDPQHRAPIYQKKSNNLLATEQNWPSASLRSLFNDIKNKSIKEQDLRYNLAHLEQNFNEEDQNIAVVLSRAENNEIFVLNQDTRLEVNDLPSAPFYIGPLEGYAIIELLSQPVFLFRTPDSLKQPALRRKVTREELSRRDQNGSVAVGSTAVRWRSLAALPLGTRSGNERIAGNAAAAAGAANAASAEDQEGEEGLGNTGDPTGKETPKIRQESEGEFSDAFTDEGQPIEDPCRYVRARLSSHRSGRYGELIPRVLASVNQRLSDNTGFSYQHQGRDFRPGRTLMMPLEIEGNYILLAAQMQPDKHINLRVFDPMIWRTTSKIRISIFEHAKELLSKSKWWQDTFESPKHMTDSLPGDVGLVPVAQATTDDGSFTYTVLNAWALAMGLEPSPLFTPSLHGHESFFIQAQQIFDLALQDELTWKVLLGFFRCTEFVRSVHHSEAGRKAKSPDELRLFNLRKRSFQDLITRQTAADTEAEGKKINMELIVLGFGNGRPHRQEFASDSLKRRERNNLAPIVREGKWNFTDTAKELKRRLEECAPPAESLPLAPNPYVDTDPVTDEFDPCLHLRMELQKLVNEEKIVKSVESGLEEAVAYALTLREVNDNIEAVGRAINELLPPGQSFTLLEHGGGTQYSNRETSGSLDDVVLMLYKAKEEDHFILVVLQHENDADYPYAVARIMDSAPWTFTAEGRIQLHELLQDSGRLKICTHSDTLKTETIVVSVLTWMHGPRQMHRAESGYFAIMNAWAVLLGLPINNDFRPGKNFFQNAYYLIQAVEKGYADWKLTWAFLRCVGYLQSTLPPPPERRFRTTRRPNPSERRKMDKERSLRATAASHDINYPYFPVEAGLAHTKAFPWDHIDEADRSTRIPEMIQSGECANYGPNQSNKDNKKDKKINGDSEEALTLPEDFDLCQYFEERREALLKDATIAAAVEKIRNNPIELEQANTTLAEWLQDQEVSLSIAAVTLGITAAQDLDGGFACLNQDAVQQSVLEDIQMIDPTIRPGQPLMVPLNHAQHLVLVVIQFGGSGEALAPTISILDSKAYHYTKDQRDTIFKTAQNITVNSNWGQHPNFPWNNERRLYTREPLHANWVPVAAQPTDVECGYHTILNAWALALGLRPNVDFFPLWTNEFFRDLIDVIHIARVGRADWKLIYAFLKCKHFVEDAEVPSDRRFHHTANLPDETALKSSLETLKQVEILEHANRSSDLNQLAHANRTEVREGRRHDIAWSSDSWTEETKYDFVGDLERWGKLNLDDAGDEVENRWRDNVFNEGMAFNSCLEEIYGDLEVQTLDRVKDILPQYRDFLNRIHPPGLNKHLDLDPCTWNKDSMHLYECILDWDPLQRSFSKEIRKEFNNLECQAWEANMVIAAVVEAIDDKQRVLYEANNPDDSRPFAGGFSIAPNAALHEALLEEPAVRHDIASRPRRCWFIPLNVSGELLSRTNKWRTKNNRAFKSPRKGQARGHTLLVVLQEQHTQPESEKLRVDIFFLDSDPDILVTAIGYLTNVVKDAAKRLGWASHRNAVDLRAVPQLYPVPAQQHGGYQCGYHTFVNAWILAMGLKPNKTRGKYSEDMYVEAWKLARAAIAGLLDWKALVAWFFCRKLTKERSFEAVTMNRRFETTVPQVPETLGTQEALGDGEVRDHARQRYEMDDRPLESLSIPEEPYDLSNNVAPPPPMASGENDKSESLDRSHDDVSLDFLHRRADIKRKSQEEVEEDFDFLRGSGMECGIEVENSAHMTPPRKRQRLGDSLSFLDTY